MSDIGKTLVCVWAALVMLVAGFIIGGKYMESHCIDYGKFVDGQQTYICELKK